MKRIFGFAAVLAALSAFGAENNALGKEREILRLAKSAEGGNREAVARLFEFEGDGYIAELVQISLGRIITPFPALFLEELLKSRLEGVDGCPSGLVGNLGEEYVDNFEAQGAELRRRSEALRSVTSVSLVPLRDACINDLESQIARADGLAAE